MGRRPTGANGAPVNIVEVIKKETAPYCENIAVIDGGRRLTYAELLAEVDRVAEGLVRNGLKPCQRVALLAQDSADYIVFSLAALAAGGVIVPLSLVLSEQETEYILDDLDVNWVISEKARVGADGRPPLQIGRFFCVRRSAKDMLPDEYEKIDPAFIRFSSGTTGKSKGVLLSHQAIIERTDAADQALKITPQDKIIWVLAMSFHFVVTILLFLRRGACIGLCADDFPNSLINALKTVSPTFIYGSPFHYYLMANFPAFAADALKSVRMAVSTAMRLPGETAGIFKQKFGFELTQAYGIIEAGLPFVNAAGLPDKRMSVGKLLPDYQLKIDQPDDSGVGRVLIKGKGMFDAYFSPWQVREKVCVRGWFDTGDLGFIDSDGYLFIRGRAKEMINFCGMKIFPQEVEEVINCHPAVAESRVRAQAHLQYGELPIAEVVLKEGVAQDVATTDLRKHCYQRLSSYKVPKDFLIVRTIAKTASGKIKRLERQG